MQVQMHLPGQFCIAHKAGFSAKHAKSREKKPLAKVSADAAF